MKLRAALLASALLLAPLASAYYHFIVYTTGTDSHIPLVTRFDTTLLPGKRLPLLIRETGAAEYAPGDNFTSLVSQIRAAAEAWNSVSTSDLKIAFSGLSSESRPMASPHIEVVFDDDMDPSIIAMGGPTNRLDPVTTSYGSFVPIVKSLVVLRSNLASPKERPVYTEKFFLTLVHELGHALGLQHSWSGGVMSTEITRTTSKAAPLTLDDSIGLSILYPAESFRKNMVSVSGRVMMGDAGVHLASVTALTASGAAVSTLTGLDGSYKLEGLPAGHYYLHVQPLPPALQGEAQPVNLVLPTDPSNPEQVLLPGASFDAQFYPGTATPQLAFHLGGENSDEQFNFFVNARDRVNLHSVQTYTFFGQEAIKPATMTPGADISPMILYGYGMSTGTAPMPGLGVTLLDAKESIAPGGVTAYAYGPAYIQLDIQKSEEALPGHRHLLFSLNGETHLVPSALRIQAQQAPVIAALTPNADGTLTIEGGPFQDGSAVMFDGVRGSVLSVEAERLTVAPPAAPFAHQSIVAVMNPDGQSTLMTMGAKSPSYTFEPAVEPALEFSPATLPAGVETILEITATGMKLTADSVQAAFGSSDVTVLKLVPLSESKALVQVAVSGQAASGAVPVAVWKELRRTAAAAQLQIGAVSTDPYVAMSRISGGTPYPGGELIVPVGNLPQTVAIEAITASIGGVPAAVTELDSSTGVVRIAVPANATLGPSLLQLTVGGATALPALVVIEAAPPVVVKVQTVMGVNLESSNAPHAGDLLQVVVRSLPDLGEQSRTARFQILSGTLEHSLLSVVPVSGKPGEYLLLFVLAASTPSDPSTLPLTVMFDGRDIGTVTIPVR